MQPKTFARSLFLVVSLLIGFAAVAADATPDQVYQAAQAGRYGEAQSMMDQILRDHPNSAKAHFVEAELLGKQGKLAQAQEELNIALRLDPSQNFARPGAVQELQTLIAAGHPSPARQAIAGIPWGLIIGIVVVALVVLMIMRARASANARARAGYGPAAGGLNRYPPAGPGTPYGPGAGYGSAAGPGAPGYGGAGGMGSGIMGGLATGAAVGAGVVAGEALMNRVLHGGSGTAAQGNDSVASADSAQAADASSPAEQTYDMGGKDFGLRDASSWDDPGNAGGDPWDDGGNTRNVAWNDDGGSGGWDDGGGFTDDGSNDDDWT
ncbi:hypothetical protein CAL14_02955 [Bordetella genomosp. 9]|uniref:tetratricopeptide repeat protein n=1 Tax=Bordetella genomosp. 9 TaxID=1416803 RepID=UPI000A296DB6|nr:tetratricopeptide repeat protein [Bordetella genomosp. 9]ARP89380.1 hypothetical protein CAL14_02955 [Bordetella genomosp. 9]